MFLTLLLQFTSGVGVTGASPPARFKLFGPAEKSSLSVCVFRGPLTPQADSVDLARVLPLAAPIGKRRYPA